MTIAKRLLTAFLAFVLCAAMSLGSLSFMPKSFAVSDVDLPFDPSPYSYIFSFSYGSATVYVGFTSGGLVLRSSSTYPSLSHLNGSALGVISYNDRRSIIFNTVSNSSGYLLDSSGSPISTLDISSNNQLVLNLSGLSVSSISFSYPSNDNINICYSPLLDYPNVLVSSSYFLVLPSTPFPFATYFDYSPFYFPQLPHGEFDGNINVVDGTYNIDFPSNASIDGSMSVVPGGGDQYTWVWNSGSVYWYGDTVQGEHEGWFSPTYQGQTPPGGTITNTIVANRDISLSLENFDSVVNYTPAYIENSRFRCWSCVMDSSYVWFVSDTRNKITGSIVSVTSDEVSWKYEFADPQGGNTIYPTWAIVFSPMGEVIQVLSPTTVSNKNTYTLTCSIGTLEQDQDSAFWSCDPLYHGFWFSNDSPPVANITHLNVAENKKYLANPVFGESAFQLNFLDSINRGIADINTNIQSLQASMQSSISNQTSAFQNMDAPSATQPSTSQMMDYFSKESAFHAPNTDEVFSGDIKSGHYWDGVTWWSSKFNDIIVSNQVIVAFTTAMLTLGLAVMIIGRRFIMR